MPIDDHDVVVFLLLAGMLYFILDDADESIMENLCRMVDHDTVADFFDGTGRTGQPISHADRWWEKGGRHLSNAVFSSAFGCRKTTIFDLVQKLYGTTGMCRTGRRGPMFDPCERTAVFLFRVGQDTTIRATSLLFGLSEGTISQVTLEVAKLVDERLPSECVFWPSPDEQREISAAWELEKQLRVVIGAIDGSHFRILAPVESLQLAHCNYNLFYSISLIAIVDHDGMFRLFISGAPGSCGDNAFFKETAFYRAVVEEHLKPVEERVLIADGACILGDSAFAESEWTRTPIGKPRTRGARFYNLKHTSHRFRAKHALGRLKKKCGGTRKGLECRLEHCADIVNACVILHNFIFAREGVSPADHGIDDAQTRNGNGDGLSEGAGAAASARSREVAYLEQKFMYVERVGDPWVKADRQRRERERRVGRGDAAGT